MFAKVSSIALVGLQALPVDVEVNLESTLPEFHVVGLPSTGVREARQRVRAAVINAGFVWPQRRITANLAPADLRKDGALLDLPIAVGVLAANGQVKPDALSRHLFVGELALDGSLRPMHGAVAAALAARDLGSGSLILPCDNASEAALVPGVCVQGAASLEEAVQIAAGRLDNLAVPPRLEELLSAAAGGGPDLADVHGQALARRALEIAAAGGHNLLLVGPPGAGKTMLARRLPGILPPLTVDEALEVTQVWSVAGLLSPEEPVVASRPFRAPHHHASAAAIIGGGSPQPRPGEVSLATHGVLFLDEVPLFSRAVLDGLRQPLEDGTVTIVLRSGTVRFPALGALVAAANPCLCPRQNQLSGACSCSPGRLAAYRSRLSGPLLDRVDLQVEVPALTQEELLEMGPSEPSAMVRSRVLGARRAQLARTAGLNGELPGGEIEGACDLDEATRRFLRRAVATQPTSGRAYHRLLRVARTIVDLDGAPRVCEAQVCEALQFRRMLWGGLMGASVASPVPRVVGRADGEYSSLLAEIPGAPALLYVAGRRLEPAAHVAAVGTRRASRYGLEVGTWIGRELVAAGIVVVSGLAAGVDAAAHRGALAASGATVAVLGCGIDVCYPSANLGLYREIAERGSLISEYPPGTPPAPYRFPARNRIIAGLCLGVVIVEARRDGGAMITARLGSEFGREVFAVPGAVHAATVVGPHLLIRDGARLVASASDVLEDLGLLRGECLQPSLVGPASLAPDQRCVLRVLQAEPMLLDRIARLAGLPTSAAASVLSRLELAGLVSRHPGGRFARPVGTLQVR